MSNVTAIHGQSLLDLCLQEYGTVEAVIAVAQKNGFTLDRELVPGEKIELLEFSNTNNEIKQFFERQKKTIQTLVFGNQITSSPVSCTLSVSDNIVDPEDTVTVAWSSTNANKVLLNGNEVSASGSTTFTINQVTAFSLVAYNDAFYCTSQQIVLLTGEGGIGCTWTQIEW